ncbi:phosphate ABC transporter permease PstA [Solilutibacter silvestris]|uniref:Phosphate transport system permease protein PstA n=1 Tax=Solilutibacter silvestris TaxID=1645665 RepID=A0A2K1PY30_9GAMM|nr:phosphate ABC transporter permease PstA [Lysobacter silvestris]PNS07683.1 phosphate ABC transporter, permease protein PstA [Lysobacter silvestris]
MSATMTAQERASQSLYRRRSIINAISVALACITAIFGLVFLAWILWTLVKNGIPGLSLHLFTQDQPPPGETSGGLRNAFVGSLIMCGMAVLIGTPIGIAAGTWLAEYGDHTKLGTAVRFVNDILMSAPSIVLGLFVYAMYVLQTGGQFSAVAGAIALAFIVLPVVVRTTDEMLRLVPTQMREAALSLGVPQWKVIMQVLYRSARAGIVTGILLSIARISGETAPLLFTALGNDFFTLDIFHPMSGVPQVMYKFAGAPDDNWQHLAWAGALVVTLLVLAISLAARTFLFRKHVSND